MKIKTKLKEYKRVMSFSRKPSKTEFMSTMKISLVGSFAVGAIGFVIFLAFILGGIR